MPPAPAHSVQPRRHVRLNRFAISHLDQCSARSSRAKCQSGSDRGTSHSESGMQNRKSVINQPREILYFVQGDSAFLVFVTPQPFGPPSLFDVIDQVLGSSKLTRF